MKTALIIAVFVASSFVGIKPADAATCHVRIPSYKIRHVRASNYNIPLACSLTRLIVKHSLQAGDVTDGQFGFRMRLPYSSQRIRFNCLTTGDAANYLGAHTVCTSHRVRVSYFVWIV
jgi:hypothetical protein